MQRHFASVLLRLSMVSVALSTVCPDIYARHLSPEEALTILESSGARKAGGLPQQRMSLRHTVVDSASGIDAVYVFGREDAPGFCIAAADDAAGDILLGYSDSSVFNPSAIHPGLNWLLDVYSARVADASGSRAQRVARPAVSPMATTMWAQEEPYNDLCPEVWGQRSAAGCVAVAVAQAMKVHQWPATGAGMKEYDYTLVEDERHLSVNVSSDFASHTYRWEDMLDSYSAGSTDAQRQAVARLVFDCGVAAATEYSSSSSASSFEAGRGMIEHFAYDKGLRYLDRKWFAYGDWEEIIYAQLKQGRPVVYSGNSAVTGHTFLIDGADADGFFHFNWGWYGISDGYYSLADLSPTDPGDETRSYNSDQNMLVDITPDNGSAMPGCMVVADVLATNRETYRGDTDYISVLGGFYSMALGELQYSIGFMADTETPKYISVISSTLDPTWGYTSLSVFAGSFPEGEYDVYPVFKTGAGEWTKMYYERAITSGHLHFVKKDGTLTVSGGDVTAPVDGDVVSAVFGGVTPADGTEPRLFPGRMYNLAFDVTADGECLKQLNAVLASESGEVICEGHPLVVNFTGASTQAVSLALDIPASVTPGKYQVGCVMKADGRNMLVSEYEPVEILEEWITLDVNSLDLHIGDEYALKVSTHSELIPVDWSSSDESVAEVNSEGVVKALGEGETRIVATCGGVSAACDVKVSAVLPDSIVIKPKYLLLEVGQSQKLDVVIYPDNTTDKTVTWTCSDPTKVMVDDEGMLTALSAGYAELTATCGPVSAMCYVSALAGIAGIEADAVSVSGGRGVVCVGAPAGVTVTVYGLDGSMRYRGTAREIALPAGTYVVSVGDIAVKAVVD